MPAILLTIVTINHSLFSTNILLYIDPGIGSIVLQAVVATVVGAILFIRFGWHRLLRFFGLRKDNDQDSTSGPDDAK